jgi:hypothetical protein
MGPFRDSDDWQEPAKLQDWVPAAYARRACVRGFLIGVGFSLAVVAFKHALEWWFA